MNCYKLAGFYRNENLTKLPETPGLPDYSAGSTKYCTNIPVQPQIPGAQNETEVQIQAKDTQTNVPFVKPEPTVSGYYTYTAWDKLCVTFSPERRDVKGLLEVISKTKESVDTHWTFKINRRVFYFSISYFYYLLLILKTFLHCNMGTCISSKGYRYFISFYSHNKPLRSPYLAEICVYWGQLVCVHLHLVYGLSENANSSQGLSEITSLSDNFS